MEMIDIVWECTFDDKYNIYVERSEPYNGSLVIFDDDKEIYRTSVKLMYNAAFGPDVEDINTWQDIVVNFIDNVYKK